MNVKLFNIQFISWEMIEKLDQHQPELESVVVIIVRFINPAKACRAT